jgi:uncharacterized protein YdhG (YjbR/CyaY superfamily)
MMLEAIKNYRESLDETGKWWFDEVSNYVNKKYPELNFVYSYQRPMFKITKDIFLMLGGGKNHFSIYTTDFNCVNMVRDEKIKGVKFGKSAVLFPHDRKDLLERAYQMCDDVIKRNLK